MKKILILILFFVSCKSSPSYDPNLLGTYLEIPDPDDSKEMQENTKKFNTRVTFSILNNKLMLKSTSDYTYERYGLRLVKNNDVYTNEVYMNMENKYIYSINEETGNPSQKSYYKYVDGTLTRTRNSGEKFIKIQ